MPRNSSRLRSAPARAGGMERDVATADPCAARASGAEISPAASWGGATTSTGAQCASRRPPPPSSPYTLGRQTVLDASHMRCAVASHVPFETRRTEPARGNSAIKARRSAPARDDICAAEAAAPVWPSRCRCPATSGPPRRRRRSPNSWLFVTPLVMQSLHLDRRRRKLFAGAR